MAKLLKKKPTILKLRKQRDKDFGDFQDAYVAFSEMMGAMADCQRAQEQLLLWPISKLSVHAFRRMLTEFKNLTTALDYWTGEFKKAGELLDEQKVKADIRTKTRGVKADIRTKTRGVRAAGRDLSSGAGI